MSAYHSDFQDMNFSDAETGNIIILKFSIFQKIQRSNF